MTLTAEEKKVLNNASMVLDPDVKLGDRLLDAAELKTGASVNAVNATKTLTVGTNPTAGDVMTIGSKLYIFVAAADSDGEIGIGLDAAATQVAIVAAINGTDELNTANASVTAGAFAENVSILTAIIPGVSGNVIALSETFTAEGNVFGGATLSGGVDGTVGFSSEMLIDDTYLYVCIADNAITGKNWRRIAVGDAF